MRYSLLAVLSLLGVTTFGQQLEHYSVGALTSSTGSTVFGAAPLVMEQQPCVTLASGLPVVLLQNGSGVFQPACISRNNAPAITFGATLDVAPNPAVANATVRLLAQNIPAESYTLSLTDASGRVLVHRRLTAAQLQLGVPVDLQAQAAGMYMLVLRGTGRMWQQKIIKQ